MINGSIFRHSVRKCFEQFAARTFSQSSKKFVNSIQYSSIENDKKNPKIFSRHLPPVSRFQTAGKIHQMYVCDGVWDLEIFLNFPQKMYRWDIILYGTPSDFFFLLRSSYQKSPQLCMTDEVQFTVVLHTRFEYLSCDLLDDTWKFGGKLPIASTQ